jgi:hypothetical protein
MSDEQREALRIAQQTTQLLEEHWDTFATEDDIDDCIQRAHRKALADIPDPALRLRVATILSYKSVDGQIT